ncbi:C2H2-type_zinc finger domain-containing protein [Hexamita inflata]|uniref:C2H2-type zinc finger domain-containing protein n=1 Tax=Hexamita inflata TaxID=28002 RepID=A0AA86QMM8_9EUKA|nr:C2H2-type zinc finger domain-containing protein [Hexamita inflata]CAI9969524.1 C2H2-type zinc finger domain-containing protein [Hexamita inflata]
MQSKEDQVNAILVKAEGKMISMDHPVPCSTCHCVLNSREEQLEHYRSDAHIQKLQEKNRQKTGDSRSPLDVTKIEEVKTEEAVLKCDICKQEFKNDNAMHAHMQSKKHRRAAAEQQQ